ncbi:hypothetical protein IAU60_001441 [Kwoniella sp. DSM 27419]
MSLLSMNPAFAAHPFSGLDGQYEHTLASPPSPAIDNGQGALDIDLEYFNDPFNQNTLLDPLPVSDKSFSHRQSVDSDLSKSLELSPVASTCTPNSTTLVSPRLSAHEVAPTLQPFYPAENEVEAEADTAEALSNHHLQRHYYYKALAAKAEAEKFVGGSQGNELDFNALFAGCNTPEFFMANLSNSTTNSNNMLAFQPQAVPAPASSFYGMTGSAPSWAPVNGSFTYQPQTTQAAIHHAQAQAHLEAADAARNQAQQHRSFMLSNYYVPNGARSSFDGTHTQPMSSFVRQPASMSIQSNSPPYPSTPTHPGVPNLVPVPVHMSQASASVSPPALMSNGPSPLSQRSLSANGSDQEGEDELSSDCSPPRSHGLDELKPIIPGMPIPNVHGGGRGYVPGETPDDPKKRHKCQICGRGFARAFNLKSHVQTHNPLRSKPYMCPHGSCKRGFSRLHDLERHRQGIHSDGPLVEAKRHGVAPSVARAQGRMQKRAESGSLI